MMTDSRCWKRVRGSKQGGFSALLDAYNCTALIHLLLYFIFSNTKGKEKRKYRDDDDDDDGEDNYVDDDGDDEDSHIISKHWNCSVS